ncbi:BsuBI/PstI family type II restriction endonuclease [Mycolicibacterium conceptionense]|uniref:BsuBI/PstI family type II restriction endonuclease n=1 Tax=Mycolicibacterium conceptionense TaxID=451644 RepID=UPI0009C0586C|nr:BsuBI/PstI family type II restriction endonuclease [Mycolicibacterium conceptionense]
MSTLPPLVSREEAEKRLHAIFPREAFDAALSSPIAAAGVVAMLYTGAVIPEGEEEPGDAHRWISPTRALWMSDEALTHTSDTEREQWYQAVQRSKERVVELLAEWGHEHRPWYSDNSREPLRDETLREMRPRGAVVWREGKAKNYGGPRWALAGAFAALFDPQLTGDDLLEAIDQWRNDHLTPLEMVKISVQASLQKSNTAVSVVLPHNNSTRHLEPGLASLILKGVIEQWAPNRLTVPVVVSISEPGNKLYVADAQLLAAAGISINVSTLLPDALIVDIGTKPAQFWVVEAVATDGEIDEERKAALIQWATDQKIPADRCRFLSAFAGRNAGPARKRLKDLATDSFAWFLDEPSHELAWYELNKHPDW